MGITATDLIASLALVLALYQLWLTSVRRGDIRMTRPTWIALTCDVSSTGRNPRAKVYLRTMLYSTGSLGHVIESMYVRLRWSTPEGERHRTFSLWVFGDERLSRGSGLYVGPTGVALNHHFVLSEQEPDFAFADQRYTLDVYAAIVGRQTKKLCAVDVVLPSQEAASIIRDGTTVFFNWEPHQERYSRLVDPAPVSASLNSLLASTDRP